MTLVVVKHVPFEGPAEIAAWAAERGTRVVECHAPAEEFPDVLAMGMVAVMGGPMAADDERTNPWLVAEKAWLSRAVDAGVPILGVCLGAQILAEVLGGRVTRNPQREIGWHEIRLTEAGRRSHTFASWPASLAVGHWHGDTFVLPPGVQSAAASAATQNQAFEVDGRFVGLQFHLEWDAPALSAILTECGDELGDGAPFVQHAEEMRAGLSAHQTACRAALFGLLDAMSGRG